MNRKAGTFTIWTEVIIFLIVILGAMTLIGHDMNEKYGTSNDYTLGLNLSSQQSQLESYSTSSMNQTTEGSGSVTDFGILKLTTATSLIFDVFRIAGSFISGNFIYRLVDSLHLGAISSLLAVMLQVLYIIAIVFIILKLVLRINI